MGQKYEAFYRCSWPGPKSGVCGCEFVAEFGRIKGTKGTPNDKGSHGITSAVKCPKCGHNLKPVDDAITIKEIKEGLKNE